MADPQPEHGKDLEADDPFALVDVRLGGAPDEEADAEMARAFASEFALMGWPRSEIRHLFDDPRYAGTHGVLRRRGSRFVEARLDEIFVPFEGGR